MQQVVIIPADEWHQWKERHEQLEKKVQGLERGLTAWVDTKEATRITGLSRNKLDTRRIRPGHSDGIWEYGQGWKQEGKYILYNRQALEAWNDTHTIRKRTTLKIA